MRERWAEEFSAKARAWWTPERTRALVGGKRPIILPGDAPALLRAMGLLHRDGQMPPNQVRKYRQINHQIAILGPQLRELRARFPVVNVLDAGCGRSYLPTLLAWCFTYKYAHPIRVLGVDSNAAIIADCRRRAALGELEEVLRHQVGPIAGLPVAEAWAAAFEDSAPLHAVISLHACDTATDDAIAVGIAAGAELIAVAPCCQAQLAASWAGLAAAGQTGAFAPIWASPHLRRALASSVTDAMRTLLLRVAGYETSAIEFVGSEHTPKNTLIRAMRRGEPCLDAAAEYAALRDATGGACIALEAQLPASIRKLVAPAP